MHWNGFNLWGSLPQVKSLTCEGYSFLYLPTGLPVHNREYNFLLFLLAVEGWPCETWWIYVDHAGVKFFFFFCPIWPAINQASIICMFTKEQNCRMFANILRLWAH